MTFQLYFTVFTPTFNRAHLLHRVYKSLTIQTLRNFEWIVLDDGSTDNTGELVRKWAKEADFPIHYFWQANSGKHVAINRGVQKAKGFFFLIIDSDDWLAENCLERFALHWEEIPEEKKSDFAGVVGLWANPAGEIVGTSFPKDILDSDTIEIRSRYRVKGDNFGVIRTEILRQFPFPEDLGSFVTEGIVWVRIALKYKQRYINEVMGYKDYQKGGLVDRIITVKAKSPLASRLYCQEFISIPRRLPMGILLKNYANYSRFSLHAKVSLYKQIADVPSKILWLLALPVGAMAFFRDCWVIKGNLES